MPAILWAGPDGHPSGLLPGLRIYIVGGRKVRWGSLALLDLIALERMPVPDQHRGAGVFSSGGPRWDEDPLGTRGHPVDDVAAIFRVAHEHCRDLFHGTT